MNITSNFIFLLALEMRSPNLAATQRMTIKIQLNNRRYPRSDVAHAHNTNYLRQQGQMLNTLT